MDDASASSPNSTRKTPSSFPGACLILYENILLVLQERDGERCDAWPRVSIREDSFRAHLHVVGDQDEMKVIIGDIQEKQLSIETTSLATVGGIDEGSVRVGIVAHC